jgi:hypothetical protein
VLAAVAVAAVVVAATAPTGAVPHVVWTRASTFRLGDPPSLLLTLPTLPALAPLLISRELASLGACA